MSDGVLYKANGSSWSKSVCKKFNATAVSDGIAKHSNGVTWYDNYPMEQLYEQYFNVLWTQAYNNSGVKLDPATWGDHPRSGDSINFTGLWGFDRAAIQAFVASGIVQDIQFEVLFDDPSHAGTPVVNFFPHVYTSKPATYDGNNANTTYTKQETFVQNGVDYTRWVKLPVAAWLNAQMGGLVARAPSGTPANSARFAGKTTGQSLNSFVTRLWIQVLK